MVTFAGELLGAAEALLRDGLHTSEVADGYGKAAAKARYRKPWPGSASRTVCAYSLVQAPG